jgi:hypothetical protein
MRAKPPKRMSRSPRYYETVQNILCAIFRTCAAGVRCPELARPGVVILQYAHDDTCPAIASQRDADCCPPCRPDAYLVRPGEPQEQSV